MPAPVSGLGSLASGYALFAYVSAPAPVSMSVAESVSLTLTSEDVLNAGRTKAIEPRVAALGTVLGERCSQCEAPLIGASVNILHTLGRLAAPRAASTFQLVWASLL